MARRGFSLFVVSANAAGAIYYLVQGRLGLAILLGAVAAVLGWLTVRPDSHTTTFRPMRTLTWGAAFFGLVTVLMLIAFAAAETGGQTVLGGIGAAVAAVITGFMVWALLRARRMGFDWSSELEKRQRPEA